MSSRIIYLNYKNCYLFEYLILFKWLLIENCYEVSLIFLKSYNKTCEELCIIISDILTT